MKKIIIFLALAVTVSAKAQTIDTAFHKMPACKIQPIQVNFTDAGNSTHLGVIVVADDNSTFLQVNWYLMDDKGSVYYLQTYVLVATDYASYVASGRSITWLFNYIANKYPQIIFE